jgi:uncharacterized protein (TIGR01319 family)
LGRKDIMMTSSAEIESLLAIDVGAINTRAFLFDITEGTYRFLATGQSPTTTGTSYSKNIGIGISQAIEALQEITGRTLIGKDGQLVIPCQPDGSGIDALVTTLSVGPAVKTIVVGLLADVSLESAQKLAATTYTRVAETIGLTDRRTPEMQIDTIIRTCPDLIIIAGGTEGGASRSMLKLLDIVGVACHLLPTDARPQILYVGNQALSDNVKTQLEPLATTHIAANVRPTFAIEDLGPAQEALADAMGQIRLHQFNVLHDYMGVAGKSPMLNASAFGRIVRFLSQAYDPAKGVLGVDLGASVTMVAGGTGGKLSLSVSSMLGMGEGMVGVQSQAIINEIVKWMPLAVSEDYVRDYIYNKPLHPASVPATLEDLAIEQAVARQILRQAMQMATSRYPGIGYNPAVGLMTQYEPVLAGGAVLTQAPTPGQAMLMLLDGLQPTGITTLVLDQNNLAAVLGAAVSVTSILPVQVLESGAFLNLGTVISPVSRAKLGTPILRVRLVGTDGNENEYEIKYGTLTVLPVRQGQKARLQLEPLHDTNVGFKRPGKGGGINVVGGVLGTVIDARGRPLLLPNDALRRRELIKKWLWTLGG